MRDPYRPVPFTPFNGTLRVDRGRTTLLEPSDSGCIVDVRNHGPAAIFVRAVRDDGNRTLANRLEPGETNGGWIPRDCRLEASVTERSFIQPMVRERQPHDIARVSVRRFRVGRRRFDQDRSLD